MRGGFTSIWSDSGSEKSVSRFGGSPTSRRGHAQPTQIVLCPTPIHPIRSGSVAEDVRISPMQAGRLGSSSSAPELSLSLKLQHRDDSNAERAWTADSENWRQASSKKWSSNAGQTAGFRKPNRFLDTHAGAVYSAFASPTSANRLEWLEFDDDGRAKSSLDQINVDEAFASMLARAKKSPYEGMENAHTPSPKARVRCCTRSNSAASKKGEGCASLDESTDKTDTLASTLSNSGWPLSPRGFCAVKEQCRQAMRSELMNMTGGAMEAFRSIDLSGSGQISFQEFSTGLTRLAVNWQEATGLDSLKKVFKLFDQRKEGALKLADLFPDALRRSEVSTYRLSTPEFLDHWCTAHQSIDRERRPKWQIEDDEQLQALCVSAESRQRLDGHKHWMSSSIRRMKKLGKSDAYCREKCALHLPKGSGPFDQERKHAFGENDVRLCRREYTDKVIGSVRNTQKTVYELRELRLELQASRRTLVRLARKREVHRDNSIHSGGRAVSVHASEREDDEEEDM